MIEQLRELHAQQQHHLAQFMLLLGHATQESKQLLLHRLPPQTDDAIGETVKHISPEIIEGLRTTSTALDGFNIITAFRDYYKIDNQSSRIVRRHPGVIELSHQYAHKEDIYGHVTQINRLRDETLNVLNDPKNKLSRSKKHEAMVKAVPGMITKMYSRKIVLLENVASIGFRWAAKPSNTRCTKSDVIDTLNAELEEIANHNSQSAADRRLAITIDLEKVSRLPHECELVYRRIKRLAPECRVRFAGERSTNTVSPVLPLIIFNDENATLAISPLKDYQDGTIKLGAKTTTVYQCVSNRLNLYMKG